MPPLVFEKSDSDSFLTEDLTGSLEKEIEEVPSNLVCPSIADLVNPSQVDTGLSLCDIPSIKAEFIDRQMSEMTQIHCKLELLELNC